MKQNCQYSIFKKSGLEQSLICSLSGKYCIKQRYCPTKRILVNTDDWHNCLLLDKEELQMANKKKVETDVEEITSVDNEQETTIVESNNTREYEVILATNNYFIINENGRNTVIYETNNYKKGDIVTF